MNQIEIAVLKVLVENAGDFPYLGFRGLAQKTGIEDRKAIRRACRSLARKGLTEFGRGLWTIDGEVAGSGYRATAAAAMPATCDRSPQGGDAQRLHAKRESAVPEGQSPNLSVHP